MTVRIGAVPSRGAPLVIVGPAVAAVCPNCGREVYVGNDSTGARLLIDRSALPSLRLQADNRWAREFPAAAAHQWWDCEDE